MDVTISVIIPCYNQAHFLNESVGSVIAQTYTNWECIIVNDGSTDDTEKVALEISQKDNRIQYIKKENGGLSSARNAGLNIAKLSLIHISEPTRRTPISYAVFCLK